MDQTIIPVYHNGIEFTTHKYMIENIRNYITITSELDKYLWEIYIKAKNEFKKEDRYGFMIFMLKHLFFAINPSYNDYILIKKLFEKIFFGINIDIENILNNYLSNDKKIIFCVVCNKYIRYKNIYFNTV